MDMINERVVVRKANQLVTAKYKSSALEQKLTALALTKLEISDRGIPSASMTTKEISPMMTSSSNVYKQLKSAAVKMLGGIVVMEDPENQRFLAFSMITGARYENGEFTITFNHELTPFISNLKSSYTSYELEVLTKLTSPYSIRMYELLKKETYKIKKDSSITVVYPLSNLKYELGTFKVDDKLVQELQKKNSSWEEIEAKAEDNSYKRWDNFKRSILDKAQQEVNEKTDIYFEYDTVRGAKGVIKQIKVTLWNNKNGGLPGELKPYIGFNGLTEADLMTLYKEAGNDTEPVINAINMANDVSYIENYMGWLRSCIKEGWRPEKVETLKGSKEKADKVKTIIESVEKQKEDPNSAMFIRMWENMQNRDDFGEYMSQISDKERDYMEFLDYQTRVENFIEWRKEHMK